LADQVHEASVAKTSEGPEKSRARAKKSPTPSTAAERLPFVLAVLDMRSGRDGEEE
jgi:hypothetical protein